MNRRQLLQSLSAVTLVSAFPARANPVHDATFEAWLDTQFGPLPRARESVEVTLPALAENGNSVAITVSVDNPMVDDNHIRTIDLFAPQNPVPHLGRYHLSPSSGIAKVHTRIRLGGDQTVRAVARTSDNRLLIGGADIVVTEAACLDFLI